MTITDQQKYIFSKIFDLTGRCNSIWIAGGAVVDLDRAGDIDLWFSNDQPDKAAEVVKKFKYFQPSNGNYGDASCLGTVYVQGLPKFLQIIVAGQNSALESLS